MPKAIPLNLDLYNKIKRLADSKFEEKTSAYKSIWIVRNYIKAGGLYDKPKEYDSGLNRWLKEKWVDISKFDKKTQTYAPCGRTTKTQDYPVCRPSVRVSSKTPKTVYELTEKEKRDAIALKKKYKANVKVLF